MNALLKTFSVAALALAVSSARADGEQQRVDELEKRIRDLESQVAERNRKADEATGRAREFNAKAEASRRTFGEQSRIFGDRKSAADREKKRFDNNTRAADDAKRRIADLEQKVAERKERVKSLDEIRKSTVNDEQVDKLRRANVAQGDIQARIDILRKILAAEEPELQKLVQENRQENELVEKNTATMKMVDAYELAKEIESAITESYKDIKATQTAIERKMSFEAAQQLTDVAKAVRLEANREAIEDNPRTKEALDRQKVAQTEVVREADTMVETVVAMMEEAMEIVKPDDAKKPHSDLHMKTIPWMEKKDFENRDKEEERQKRLEEMSSISEFQVAITEAAAENEEERAKDLTQVMEDAGEVKKNTELADMMEKKSGGDQQQGAQASAGTLVPLQSRMPELVAGNVLRFADGGKGDGIPAKWAYVQDWYVIGPFPNPNRINLRRKFPPESVVDLEATYVGKDGRTIKWEFMQTRNETPRETWRSDGKAEIVPFTAEEYGIWYAYAEVFCDTACDRWIAVGSDDRSDIWVNDIPVWGSSNKLKSWRVDEGYRRIRLNKGRNRILARIENGWHALGWSMSISMEDGVLPK